MKIQPEKTYELKKDVSMPGEYHRAGRILTGKEWAEIFPRMADMAWNEWFIDTSMVKEKTSSLDMADNIINDVFFRKGLHSISYKEAAKECIIQYKRLFDK
jgi:hypothetical protein